MKNILFIGAGGFASECYQYLNEIINIDNDINFKGFLSTTNDLAPYGLEHLFIGHYDDYNFEENDYIIIAIGDPDIRKNLYEKFKNKNVKFFTLISPYAVIPKTTSIGEGSVIANFCTTASNVKIGVCNVINSVSSIGHDAVIGNFNIFSCYTDVCGFTTIGDCNYFGSRCSILPHTKIGNSNKIVAGSVLCKKYRNNNLIQGNPAISICNKEDI